MTSTYVSHHLLDKADSPAEGTFVDLKGERFYRITNLDAMAPFFMSLVSDSDHWLFISSNGALTAGRKHPDEALFPYHADDRIHDSLEHTGCKTILRITRQGQTHLWEPFSSRYEGLYPITRSLYKSIYGNKILFEEVNHELQLTFRYAWMNSDTFGFVRHSELLNHGHEDVAINLVDGLQNVLPFGLGWRFQLEYSTLGDGYKRTELLEDCGLALFRLSSLPVDKPEPSEALRVNLAWSLGLKPSALLLSSTQLKAFRASGKVHGETDIRGRRGAYLLHATLALPPGGHREWFIVADVGKDALGVASLSRQLRDAPALATALRADIQRGTDNLLRLVASADGLQATEDEPSTCRHFSNTLFNIMRGGIPALGYQIPTADFHAFLLKANADVAASYDAFLAGLPEFMPLQAFLDRIADCDDPDLARLGHEYLPLTFSRRHGDPSRPWNIFSILVKHEDGSRIFNYQGNWRDIFQNWEALGFSFPSFLESMIFKFVDSSTADGHNPYRVLREGFEWETIDPHDPWSFIGYWGDHQVIYLLKLLESSRRYHPGHLGILLKKRLFTYADVPYRIKAYEALLENPRSTITFEQEAHSRAMEAVEKLGADGKLLVGPKGPVRANLAEKLLVVALSKLGNFIPAAGIWMNTQRPEWNDANNALVGYGVSVVTLCYLRRYLDFIREIFREQENSAMEVAREVVDLFKGLLEVFEAHVPTQGQVISDQSRKLVLDGLGKAASDYREHLYRRGFSGDQLAMSPARLVAFCDVTLRHIDHAIRANRRDDGLYHAYNLMKVVGDGIQVRHLYKMLEGQVAVLSSGILSGAEAADLLDALRESNLYRADLGSYMLYPDRALPKFLDKNRLPEDATQRSALLKALLKDGDGRIVARDSEGIVRFNASFRSAMDLQHALTKLKDTKFRTLAAQDEALVLELYEEVFDHQSFTGRSGTFFKYEGLGCVYWHMVSKLLLAVGEVLRNSLHEDPSVLFRLQRHYRDIRAGLGVHKSPMAYGAVPTDPYSHTPSFAGVQQPGMTGQVKEDFLSRFSELGVQVQDGRLTFQPWATPKIEFLSQPREFRFVAQDGQFRAVELKPGTLAFTVCQVPVVMHRSGTPRIEVLLWDGSSKVVEGLALDPMDSAEVFQRSGTIQRLNVHLGITG